MIPAGGSVTNQSTMNTQQPSHTWKIDFERRRVVGKADGLEAVKQAVFKISQTERFRYLIYDSDYGIELDGLIGKDPVLVKSELRRRIREALTQDDRINDVKDLQIDPDGDQAQVKFTVESIYGTFQQEVTVNV